jgi:SAM-dependent methyltransferase
MFRDGIWFCPVSESISYPNEGNEQCFEVEDISFWFRHRNACIIELLRQFPPPGNGAIFDVGGGNGFVAKGLQDAGLEVVLVEPGTTGAHNAKKRGVKNVVCATTQAVGFTQGSMAAIGVFDVVEHIDDDSGFLRHLSDLLKPNGMLYLTVPAYRFLWSAADVQAGHFRRYNLTSLNKKLEHSGFKVEFSTYMFWFLPLTVFLFRTLPYQFRRNSASISKKHTLRDHATKPGLTGRFLSSLLKCELSWIVKTCKLPFGGSCLVAARKA